PLPQRTSPTPAPWLRRRLKHTPDHLPGENRPYAVVHQNKIRVAVYRREPMMHGILASLAPRHNFVDLGQPVAGDDLPETELAVGLRHDKDDFADGVRGLPRTEGMN